MPQPEAPSATLIAVELGYDTPDDELSYTGLARRFLLRGQTVWGYKFAERYGCSATVVNGAVNSLRKAGYTIEQVVDNSLKEDGSKSRRRGFKMAGSNGSGVTPPGDDPAMKLSRSTKARKARHPVPTTVEASPPAEAPDAPPPIEVNGSGGAIDLTRLPTLLQSVSVFALAANDDGTITIGLRDEETRWLLTLTGQHER